MIYKGNLYKKGNEWFVKFDDYELMLHPDDVKNVNNINDNLYNLNGKGIHFEIVTKYIEPDESIHCNRGVDKKFAKLIDSKRKEEVLNEIKEKAENFGIFYVGSTKKDSTEVNKTEKIIWDDNKVIDFVNWFLKLHKLPFNYTLENREILESFKRGDDFSIWHTKEE